MDFWVELPPPNISLAIIAKAHGAKFDEKPRKTSAPEQDAELAQLLGSIPQRSIKRPSPPVPVPTPHSHA